MKIVLVGNYDRAFVMCRMELLSALARGGHEVLVCAPRETAGVEDELLAAGVRFHAIKLKRTGMNPFRDACTFAELVALFRKTGPDIVISYTIKPVIYGSLAARLCKVPRIFSMITGLGYLFIGKDLQQKVIRLVMSSLYRKALSVNHRVFFLNLDDLGHFATLGLIDTAGRPTVLNGEGIDIDHFAERPVETARPIFLMIARLIRDKGVHEYVTAATALKLRYPHAAFRLLGPFDANPTAIKASQVEQWLKNGTIEYLGETSDVRPYLSDATVYVLPSYREGLPLTVMEAMSTGRPIVTTDAPGCRQTVIDGENGFVVPVKDSDALANAMERFILQPELVRKMGKRSREIAEERYDVRKVVSVIMRSMELVQ